MKRRIRYLCVLLCACLLFTGCAAAGTAVYDGRTVTFEEPTWPETEDEIFVSMAELTMEQVVSGASHIVDAEFLGFYAWEKAGETHLLFELNQIYKGAFEEKKPRIYVTKLFSDYRLDPGEKETYEVGKNYMLFLEKHISVYYDYDIYAQTGQVYMPEGRHNWEATHAETKKLLATVKNTAYDAVGIRFTTSEKMKDVVDSADGVFVVRVDKRWGNVPKTSFTTQYRCSVTKTLKGEPNNQGYLVITFFNDTVELGKEYVVLINSAETKSFFYGLASKNSLFTLEEAEEIPELKVLLDQAEDYTTVIPGRGTYAEELEKEMEQFAEELAKNPELKAQLEAELERLKEAEKTQD